MRHFDAGELNALLDYPGLIESLREVFRKGVDVLDRVAYSEKTTAGQNSWILLPSWQYGGVYGIKLVSVFPGNQARGLDSVQGLYVLFDGTSGLPIATMDGAALTLKKTAANSALAATYLAREDTSTLLMCGAGALAPHFIEAHCSVRPITRVLVWNRTAANAEKLARDLSSKLAVSISATTQLEEAVREADMISCATMASAPFIRGAWLKPGTHVDLVGGFTPDMREADDEAVQRSRVFVDAPSTIIECGDITQPLASKLLFKDDITDTFQLASGERPGRISPDQITLFKSGGGGHEDLGTAKYVLKRCELGVS